MRDFKCKQFDCIVPCECKGCKDSPDCQDGYCINGQPVHGCDMSNPTRALPAATDLTHAIIPVVRVGNGTMCIDWT